MLNHIGSCIADYDYYFRNRNRMLCAACLCMKRIPRETASFISPGGGSDSAAVTINGLSLHNLKSAAYFSAVFLLSACAFGIQYRKKSIIW